MPRIRDVENFWDSSGGGSSIWFRDGVVPVAAKVNVNGQIAGI
jgi:hypothetical protein